MYMTDTQGRWTHRVIHNKRNSKPWIGKQNQQWLISQYDQTNQYLLYMFLFFCLIFEFSQISRGRKSRSYERSVFKKCPYLKYHQRWNVEVKGDCFFLFLQAKYLTNHMQWEEGSYMVSITSCMPMIWLAVPSLLEHLVVKLHIFSSLWSTLSNLWRKGHNLEFPSGCLQTYYSTYISAW